MVTREEFEARDRDLPVTYVVEEDIPNWTKLVGYQVVYYNGKYRISCGNPIIFPLREMAEKYKNHYNSYPWFHEELLIEEVEYEGVPLSEPTYYNGKTVIDEERYFTLDACETGDYFTEDLVDAFMDMLPPACMRSDCSQIGEAVSCRTDDDGNLRNTYSTFKKVETGIWEYCGDCFRGENVKRGKEISAA